MRKYKTIVDDTDQARAVVDLVFCDICDKAWEYDNWDGFEIAGATDIQKPEYDVCPKCFKNNVEPILRQRN